MFYQGDLQSGIALAMQSQKHVVCLVCGQCDAFICTTNARLTFGSDDGDISSSWEETLADEIVRTPAFRGSL
jgi:hypothetical protein